MGKTDQNLSDHLPISMEFMIANKHDDMNQTSFLNTKVKWAKITTEDMKVKYADPLKSVNALFRKYFPCVKTGDGHNEYIVTNYYLSKDNVYKVVDEIATKMVVTIDHNIPKANFNKHIQP